VTSKLSKLSAFSHTLGRGRSDYQNIQVRVLVADFECRRVLGLHFAPIIDASGGDIGVAEPFLDLGDVGFVVQGVGGGRGALLSPSAKA
jgi:hypothetical protein